MRFVLFYHSLVSDGNHGNAHFLRGVVADLQGRRSRASWSGWAAELARHGRQTILARHTCAHRVDELLVIVASTARPASTVARVVDGAAAASV